MLHVLEKIVNVIKKNILLYFVTQIRYGYTVCNAAV